jgi:hypothetical protein
MKAGAQTHEQRRACAARWMYERRERVDWWRWSVLTDVNTDPEGLRLPHKEAVVIFADLVQRGLLIPVVAGDDREGFTINPGRDAEWQEVMHPTWTWFKEHGLTMTGYVVSAFVGAGVTLLVG